ncbi:hypothetical protein SESBI_21091 [Sesbania bispinosa]|nr:hypothetical protein SESBI_21091 [Sesbania bispinosa]
MHHLPSVLRVAACIKLVVVDTASCSSALFCEHMWFAQASKPYGDAMCSSSSYSSILFCLIVWACQGKQFMSGQESSSATTASHKLSILVLGHKAPATALSSSALSCGNSCILTCGDTMYYYSFNPLSALPCDRMMMKAPCSETQTCRTAVALLLQLVSIPLHGHAWNQGHGDAHQRDLHCSCIFLWLIS